MKNIIIIDIDTERKPIVQIGKPQESELPKNSEEAKDFIIKDMACLSEALCSLIHAADQNGFKPTSESLKDCITHLERAFPDTSEENVDKESE